MNKWKDKLLRNKFLDILCKYDVFMDISNSIIASTEADKMINDLVEIHKSELNSLLDKIEKEILEVKNKKFPRGERRWCVECATRIRKELRTKLRELRKHI